MVYSFLQSGKPLVKEPNPQRNIKSNLCDLKWCNTVLTRCPLNYESQKEKKIQTFPFDIVGWLTSAISSKVKKKWNKYPADTAESHQTVLI